MLTLMGCSSPKDASKDNFIKVINNYIEKECVMVTTGDEEFPATIELRPTDNIFAAGRKEKLTAKYDALVSVGMLEVKEGSAQVNKGMFDKTKVTVPTKIYSLSTKGKQSVSESGSVGKKQIFCVAKYQVDEIKNFSEPAPAMGYKISKVNYSFSPTDVVDWASNENILAAFPRLSKQLEKNQEKSVALVLMNDGWVHERDVRR